MTGRKCSTCKHYEPAPIWRKGWCRNPMLFSPQQSHLVGEEDLDCERGMGNYWEPGEGADIADPTSGVFPLPIVLPRSHPTASQRLGGQPVFSISGSSGYSTDDPDDDLPPQNDSARITTPGGRDRSLTYYAEERYWTDYLRIAAPILGVILVLILFWFWLTSFLGDDDNGNNGNAANSTSTSTLPIIGASPSASAQAGATGTPQMIVTAPAVGTTPVGAVATNTPEAPAGGEIVNGSIVQVANTGVEGVNLRAEATTSSEVVAVLIDGTQLTVNGEAVQSEGLVWWPVEGEAGSGWIAADYLALVQ
jgi:hypothetical protein